MKCNLIVFITILGIVTIVLGTSCGATPTPTTDRPTEAPATASVPPTPAPTDTPTATTRGGSPPNTYYVSPEGNDNNPGTEESPFLTIERAKQAVRSAIASGMSSDIAVFIRGGRYSLSSPLSFDEGDSGRDGYRVIYKNYPNEEPVIIGGQRITNWEHDSSQGDPEGGSIYKAYVGDWKFYTLMENGVLSTMARTPNQGYLRVESEVSSENKEGIFTYKAGDLPEGFDYSDAQIYVWVGKNSWEWFSEVLPITKIAWGTRTITVHKYSDWWPILANDRYFVRGAKEFLDRPGEFYLDESTGYLYYWPRKTPIQNQEIIAPKTKRIIELIGSSSSSLVKNIQFEGLTLTLTDFVKEHGMYYGTENKVAHALVYMENAENIVIKYSKIKNAGFDGILLYRYAQGNTIYGNLIENIGKHGVRLRGFDVMDARLAYVNKNNIISNNYIRDCGKLWGRASAIWVTQSGSNEITHNEITKMPFLGIVLMGRNYAALKRLLGDQVTWENHWDFLYTRDNYVGFNDVSDVLKDANDGGGIYAFGTGKHNIVDNNRVHDIASGYADNPAAVGIYFDTSADYFTVKNNIVYGISGSRAQPILSRGSYNTFINNIIADNLGSVSIMAPLEIDFANQYPESTYGHHSFVRNIFYRQNGRDIYMFNNWGNNPGLSYQVDEVDYNLYFHPGGEYYIALGRNADNTDNIRTTYEEWRTLDNNKYDQHSVVADPMFLDRANHDYTLQGGSPAFALGFENIDQQNIGLKSDFPWDTGSSPTLTPTPTTAQPTEAPALASVPTTAGRASIHPDGERGPG